MKKIVFALTLLLSSITSSAQSFDDIIASRRAIDCRDVHYNALDIISSLYTQNEIDSLYSFLEYWEEKCGGRYEAIEHTYTLLDIISNKFNTDSLSQKHLELLISYREVMDANDPMYPWLYSYNRDNTEEKAFFNYLGKIAKQSDTSKNIDEQLIQDFYQSEHPNFSKIKHSSSDSSELKRIYNKTYNETMRMSQLHLAFITGFVHHFGKLDLFGTRPTFGFVLGSKNYRNNYDFVLDIRAGDSPKEYSVMYDNQLINTKDWVGLYFGFEYAYDIYYSQKFDLSISPGIGWDRITAVYLDSEYGEDPKFINSFNYNGGLVFKYKYGKRGGYLGVHARYNWSNYNNEGGTELAGEYFNLRLTWGSLFNPYRKHRLKMLE